MGPIVVAGSNPFLPGLLAGKISARRGHFVIAALMHQQALDRDAALTVDQEHPPKMGAIAPRRLDVRQHYPASLPPNSRVRCFNGLGGGLGNAAAPVLSDP